MFENHQKGSSLIELMIAAMVSLVLIGAVLSTVIQQGHQRQATNETALALSAALNNLEYLRTVDEATLPTLDGKDFDIPASNGQPYGGLTPQPGDPDGYPGKLSVFVDQNKAGVTLYRVVATVSWTGVSGKRQIRLQALMGERK
jgi:type II secretory pathway pseudopilin PulG